MSLTTEQLASEALSLPKAARAALAERLLQSLDPAEDGEIKRLWQEEIRRRCREIDEGRVKLIPAAEVFAQVRKAIGR